MAPWSENGTGFDPSAIERVEWLAQRDLGASVPGTAPEGGLGIEGHWRRYLRGAHPPRFRAPDRVRVSPVGTGDDTQSFGATAAFGLRLPARAESALASLPARPGWRCYVAHAGDAPPAAAATFGDGPIVLLAVDATAEAGRRSSSRMALLHRVVDDAVEAGARVIGARIDEEDESRRDAAAGLLLAGFESTYLCPAWVDAGLPAS